MSLQTSVKRALTESDQLKSDKQLLTSIKEAEIRQAVQYAIREELKTKTIEKLKESDTKSRIVRNILFEEIDDIIANRTEQDYYFYKIRDLYDKELKKIEKIEKQKQKEQEQQEQEAEKMKMQEETLQAARRQAAIDLFFKILGIIGLILLAPLIFCILIIFEALKNTK